MPVYLEYGLEADYNIARSAKVPAPCFSFLSRIHYYDLFAEVCKQVGCCRARVGFGVQGFTVSGWRSSSC